VEYTEEEKESDKEVEYTEEEKEDMDDISPLGKFDVER
jgi:hypothetical protein